MKKGTLFVVSAASGTGKTSLVNELVRQVSNLYISISHTTRPIRPGEVHAENYFFIDNQEFLEMIKKGLFVESANVFGYGYGTSKEQVFEKLEQGVDVILEIDWQGACQIFQKNPYAVSIFILPPALKVLETRLKNRAQDSPEVISKRLEASCQEISHYNEFHYIVKNDSFDDALEKLKSIVLATRCDYYRHTVHFDEFVKKLIRG
jgi:guanylate kinase